MSENKKIHEIDGLTDYELHKLRDQTTIENKIDVFVFLNWYPFQCGNSRQDKLPPYFVFRVPFPLLLRSRTMAI